MPLTQEQINAMDAALGQPSLSPDVMAKMDAVLAPSSSTFDTRMAEDRERRVSNIQDIQSTPQSALSRLFQEIGQGAGLIGDYAGNAAISGYQALPEMIKQPIEAGVSKVGEGVSALGSLPVNDYETIGDKTKFFLGSLGSDYATQREIYPEATRNIEAAGNLAMLSPAVKPLAYGGVKTVESLPKIGEVALETARRSPDLISKKPVILSSREIKDISSDLYDKAQNLGATLTPNFTNKIDSQASLLIPKTEWGKIGSTKGETLDRVISDINALKDKGMTLRDAEDFDKRLGEMISDQVDPTGEMTSTGHKLYKLQTSFRDLINNPDVNDIVGSGDGIKAWRAASDAWSAKSRMRDIERILRKSETYNNPATYIKRQFANIEDSKRFNGYSDAAKKFISQIARDDKLADFLRTTAGSRLIGSVLGGGAGGFGGPLGIAAGAVAGATLSEGARGAAEALKRRQVSKLSREVGSKVIDESSALGKLYKYYGKERGDSMYSQIQNGESPSGLFRIPSNDRKLVLEELERVRNAPITDPTRLLPSPQREMAVPLSGGAVERSAKDIANSELMRQRARDIGLTPDVSRAVYKDQIRKVYNPIWDKIDLDTKALIDSQAEEMWKNNAIPIEDMIKAAQKNIESTGKITGKDTENAFTQAFKKALETKEK